MESKAPNRYTRILEAIFARHYKKGAAEIEFDRIEINQVADELGMLFKITCVPLSVMAHRSKQMKSILGLINAVLTMSSLFRQRDAGTK